MIAWKLRRVLPHALLLGWLLRSSLILDFALGRQENLRLLRERDGLAKTSRARNPNVTLSNEGRDFLGRIKDAGERGDWHQVRAIFRTYTGQELPVFHAVLHAALNCGQYGEGASAYEKLCGLKVQQDAPTFATAMKTYAKMGNASRVREIWAAARQHCQLDAPLSAARIDAAAAEGVLKYKIGSQHPHCKGVREILAVRAIAFFVGEGLAARFGW